MSSEIVYSTTTKRPKDLPRHKGKRIGHVGQAFLAAQDAKLARIVERVNRVVNAK